MLGLIADVGLSMFDKDFFVNLLIVRFHPVNEMFKSIMCSFLASFTCVKEFKQQLRLYFACFDCFHML